MLFELDIGEMNDLTIKPGTIDTLDVLRHFPELSKGSQGIILDP